MDIELTTCIITHLKYGVMEQIVFSHPNYFIAWCNEPVMEKYKKAFVVFNISNN